MKQKKIIFSVIVLFFVFAQIAVLSAFEVNIKGKVVDKSNSPVSNKPIKIKFQNKYFTDNTNKDGSFNIALEVNKYQRSRTYIEVTCCFETIKAILDVGPSMKSVYYLNGQGSISLKSLPQYAKAWKLQRSVSSGEKKVAEKKENEGKFPQPWTPIQEGPGNIKIKAESKWNLRISRKNSAGKLGRAGLMAPLPRPLIGRSSGKSLYVDLSFDIKHQSMKGLQNKNGFYQYPIHIYFLDRHKNVIADLGISRYQGDQKGVDNKRVIVKESGWKNINIPFHGQADYIQVFAEGHDFDVLIKSLRIMSRIKGGKKERWLKCYWQDKAFELK